MKKLLALVLLALLAIPVFACAEVCEYEITLPAGYETSGQAYPTAYLLPQDGYAADDSGITEKLAAAMEIIIVRPAFEVGDDLHASLAALVDEIDSSYRTLPQAEYRVLLGAGTGGYLAYALGLTENAGSEIKALAAPSLFGAIASIRGNFAGEDNPWIAAYGNLYDRMDLMQLSQPGVFDSFYTYMDAPVDDAWTNMEGSSNDLGALFIGFGTGSAAHEFTVRPGSFDDAFLTESVSRVAARLSARMFPAKEEAPAPAPVIEPQAPVIDGDYQAIDLSGDWQFKYVGAETTLDIASLTKAETDAWHTVQPTTGNWTNGYGNISDENVNAMYGPDYFDYFIVGAGYYAKTFTVPENFDAQDVMLSIGYVDDRCEVFLNGVRVGATGMDENGQPTGDTTWAMYSRFDIDPALIVRGGENTVIVRAWNDVPMGAGGWYGGPIGLYSMTAFEEINPEKANERFYEETFSSQHAASALGQSEPVENPYLIYLPEGYAQSDRRYPTVYLLHQFNSDHTSYKTDKVDQLFDEGIASGLFDEMIVVIPNSDPNSWWTGEWEKMVTEELIPHIDGKYRTIRDARYRLTAGCSMGGQGSMAVALRNPDFFSGVISFFGAFSYGGENSPNAIAAAESAEYMDSFAIYFICGNQDSYGFGAPAIELNQLLESKGVDHGFFIENGGHDSAFYVPYFDDAFAYIRANMYKSDEAAAALMTGALSIKDTAITASFSADAAIADYLYTVPASSYTKNPSPALSIPLTLEIIQGDRVIYAHELADHTVSADDLTETFEFDMQSCISSCEPITVVLKASIFDRVVTLATAE